MTVAAEVSEWVQREAEMNVDMTVAAEVSEWVQREVEMDCRSSSSVGKPKPKGRY